MHEHNAGNDKPVVVAFNAATKNEYGHAITYKVYQHQSLLP